MNTAPSIASGHRRSCRQLADASPDDRSVSRSPLPRLVANDQGMIETVLGAIRWAMEEEFRSQKDRPLGEQGWSGLGRT